VITFTVSALIFAAPLLPMSTITQTVDGQLVVKTCTGRIISLDLGSDQTPDQTPPPHFKICHAVCCEREDDEDEPSPA